MPVDTAKNSQRALLFFLSLSLATALMNSSAPTPLYPLYLEQLHLSTMDLTFLFGAYGAGVLTALITLASLAGSIQEQRFLLIPAITLILIGTWLFSVGETLWLLCAARMIAGLGAGIMTASVNVALARFGPDDNGKLSATLATLSMIAGLALGPLISGVALQLDSDPTRLPYWLIMICLSIGTIGTLTLWPRNPVATPRHSPARSSLPECLRGIGQSFHLCAWSVFLSWSFAACVFVIGPNASEQQLGLRDRGLFGYYIATYLLIAGASQVYSRRLKALHALQTGLLAQCTALLLLLSAFWTHSPLLAAAGLVVGGYAYGAIFVGSARLVNQLAPTEHHAKLVAYFYMTIYLFNAVPIPLGFLVDQVGLAKAVPIALTVFLSSFAVLVLLLARVRQPPSVLNPIVERPR